MTTKLELRMTIAKTDADYLATHFVRIPDMVVYHNMLKDGSTACGMQLIGVRPGDLKPEGEPRCGRCVKAVDAILDYAISGVKNPD